MGPGLLKKRAWETRKARPHEHDARHMFAKVKNAYLKPIPRTYSGVLHAFRHMLQDR